MVTPKAKNPKTSPELVRKLWVKYFPDVNLTDTRWYENYELGTLEDGMRITANKQNEGRFPIVNEDIIGKYIAGVIKKLGKGNPTKVQGPLCLVRAEVWLPVNYRITPEDSARFKAYLAASPGDHQLFQGTKKPATYGRFWVNKSFRWCPCVRFLSTTGPITGGECTWRHQWVTDSSCLSAEAMLQPPAPPANHKISEPSGEGLRR